jgi:hypothetical protein
MDRRSEDSGQAVTGRPLEQAGVVSATTPISRTLPMPFSHLDVCIVNVHGTLSQDGTELTRVEQG